MDPVANVPRTTPPAPAVLENAQRQPAGPHAAAAFAPVSTPYGVVAGVGRRGGVLARRSEESWALSTDYAAVQTQRSVGHAPLGCSRRKPLPFLPPSPSPSSRAGARRRELLAASHVAPYVERRSLSVPDIPLHSRSRVRSIRTHVYGRKGGSGVGEVVSRDIGTCPMGPSL